MLHVYTINSHVNLLYLVKRSNANQYEKNTAERLNGWIFRGNHNNTNPVSK